jgi:hypothetical protein
MAISFARSERMRFFYLWDMLEGKICGNNSCIYAILQNPFVLLGRQPHQQNLDVQISTCLLRVTRVWEPKETTSSHLLNVVSKILILTATQ